MTAALAIAAVSLAAEQYAIAIPDEPTTDETADLHLLLKKARVRTRADRVARHVVRLRDGMIMAVCPGVANGAAAGRVFGDAQRHNRDLRIENPEAPPDRKSGVRVVSICPATDGPHEPKINKYTGELRCAECRRYGYATLAGTIGGRGRFAKVRWLNCIMCGGDATERRYTEGKSKGFCANCADGFDSGVGK